MKSFAVATVTAAVLCAIAITSASAAPMHRYHGGLTPSERAAIARSAHDLSVLRARIHADGRVTRFERMRLNWAQSRHKALVARYRNN